MAHRTFDSTCVPSAAPTIVSCAQPAFVKPSVAFLAQCESQPYHRSPSLKTAVISGVSGLKRHPIETAATMSRLHSTAAMQHLGSWYLELAIQILCIPAIQQPSPFSCLL